MCFTFLYLSFSRAVTKDWEHPHWTPCHVLCVFNRFSKCYITDLYYFFCGKCPRILIGRRPFIVTVIYIFIAIFVFYFPCCSLKLECEKLASEKIEIQRHYVMVSMLLSCVLRNCRSGGSCKRVTCDIAPDIYQKCANVATKFLNWMFVLSFICDLTLKICIIRAGGEGGNSSELVEVEHQFISC